MNQIASFALLALVFSMVIGGIPIDAYAKTDYTVLLRLVSDAQSQIEKQIATNDNKDIEKLYNEGLKQVELLKADIEEDNVESAREHFLLAMRIFNKITRDAPESTNIQPEASSAARQHDHISNLERTKKYVENLKLVAKKHGADINFEEIDKLFVKIREQINDKNYDEVKDDINKLNRTVLDINKTLREYANQISSDRAKTYAQQYIEKVDRLIAQAEGKVSDEIIQKLEDAKERLANASDKKEVIKIVRTIISIEQEFDLTKANQLESRMMQLEKKARQLAGFEGIDESEIENLRQMISEIKQLISKAKLDEANGLLHELNDKLKELQNSLN